MTASYSIRMSETYYLWLNTLFHEKDYEKFLLCNSAPRNTICDEICYFSSYCQHTYFEIDMV